MKRTFAIFLTVPLAGAAAVMPLAVSPTVLLAQDNPDMRVSRIAVNPDTVRVRVGERVPVEIIAVDEGGNPVPDADLLAYSNGAEASLDPVASEVIGVSPGETTVGGRIRRPVAEGPGFQTLRASLTVIVLPRPVERIEIVDPPDQLYAGTRTRLHARAHSTARARDDAMIEWSSSDPSVVEVGMGGVAYARSTGRATLTAMSEGVEQTIDVRVVTNPIERLSVEPRRASVQVGDVLRLAGQAVDANGRAVSGAELDWSWAGLSDQPYDAVWLDAEGTGTGVFVANAPGIYRVTATVGSAWADVEIEATPRPFRRQVRRIAHGVAPTGQATTDLWVFEGVDGKDYVYTGTFSGNLMYAWDVSDPSNPVITDSLAFDGRRVNDVKINADATLAVITSENAASRRNGISLLDITDPAHPTKISHFTENLTGGVHNTWIEGDLVYAVHYGTRDIHIIDIGDPANPRNVGRWGLSKEDKFVHDINITDGLAYLSYWDDGVVVLDVGNGIKGGTPIEPQFVTQYKYSYKLGPQSYGNTHHAIRYGDYIFTGDEIFGCDDCVNGARGYIHVIDVSDIENPREVAYYRVPEAGSHNMWAEDGKLYIGYYGAGLRIVDISGELRGDLYRQGREIGWFMTADGAGNPPYVTATWGAQPYKGLIYASDGASGLWVVELLEPEPELVP